MSNCYALGYRAQHDVAAGGRQLAGHEAGIGDFCSMRWTSITPISTSVCPRDSLVQGSTNACPAASRAAADPRARCRRPGWGSRDRTWRDRGQGYLCPGRWCWAAGQAGRSAVMEQQFVGLDVSQAETTVRVVDAAGVALWQGKCA